MNKADLSEQFSQLKKEFTEKAANPKMSFYDHESQFVEQWMELGRKLYEECMDVRTKDLRKKKHYDPGRKN